MVLSNRSQLLRKYYQDQVRTGRGSNIVYWKGSRMQRGHGIGSIIGKILKSPIVKKGLKYVAKTGLNTAGDVISQVLDGKSLKDAGRSSVSRQVERQKKKAMNKLKQMVNPTRSTSFYKPPQKHVYRGRKRIKRRKANKKSIDNFSKSRR